jgi:tubulin polyglutamylase TTLL6/13
MKKSQKVNHFPGMFEISRKNCLAKNLNRFRESFPNDYDFYPSTWLIPQEILKLKSHFKGACPTLIVKPEASSQGKGIFIVDRWEELQNLKNSIAQVYINNPLLIDGLKFDLRIYVLVAGCDPLRVFIHEEGLARFATEQYQEPDRLNKDNRFMHLTNYAINKNNTNFVQNDDEGSSNSHKRSLSSVLKDLEMQGKDSAGLWDDICDLIIKTLLTAQPFLANTYKSAQSHDYFNGMCFEVLGFDVLVDSDLRPWLLEVNFTPSFTTDSQLDHRVKHSVIHDTLKLISLNEKCYSKLDKIHSNYSKKRQKTKQEISELKFYAQELRDEFEDANCGGFIKIYPGADQFCYSKFLKHSQILWTGGLLELVYVPRIKRVESAKRAGLKSPNKGRVSFNRLGTVSKVLNFDSLDTTHSRSRSFLNKFSCDTAFN